MDPIIPTAIVSGFAISAISKLFEESISSLNSFEEWGKGEAHARDLLGTSTKKYLENVAKIYNRMQIFGMNKPIPLDSIFVRVNVLEDIAAFSDCSHEELVKQLNVKGMRFERKDDPVDGNEFVRNTDKVVVLGKPGAGKSTFLKHLIFDVISEKYKKQYIPIFVGLKWWTDHLERNNTPASRNELLDYIIDQFDICNFPDAKGFIERVLKNGKCILLLDGFDEVSHDVNAVIGAIRDFSNKYSDNRFVLSCRIAAYNYNSVLDQFTTVEMADFNDEQIEKFINNYFIEDLQTAERCWKHLKGNNRTLELATSPLILTLLCITYRKTGDFPPNRSEIYEKAVNAFLDEWNASRSIIRRIASEGKTEIHLSLREKETLLSLIAAHSFERNEIFIKQETIENDIKNYLINIPDINERYIYNDSHYLLKTIESDHGLLVERAKGVYSFSHLTLQEYFTAKYIVDNEAEGSVNGLMQNHLTDEKWKEVILLTSGMMKNASRFVIQMRSQITKHTNNSIKKFLNDIDEKLNPNTNINLFALRLIFIDFIDDLLFYENVVFELADHHVIALDSDQAYFHARQRAYDQAYTYPRNHEDFIKRKINISYENACDFAYKISQNHEYSSLFQYICVEDIKEIIKSFNQDILLSLGDYFYSSLLLWDCLESPAYIDRNVRKELMESLYLETPDE